MKVRNLLKEIGRTVGIIAVTTTFYLSSCLTLGGVSHLFSSTLERGKGLEEALKEEVKTLGLEGRRIQVEYEDEVVPRVGKSGEGYWMVLPEKVQRSSLRHELYHIADGHCDLSLNPNKGFGFFVYLLYYEPQAVLYQATGLEL